MATDNSIPGFAREIRPMFRESDKEAMVFAFDLWDFNDVCMFAQDILERLQDGSMPCDQEWPEAQIIQFQRWIEVGMPA